MAEQISNGRSGDMQEGKKRRGEQQATDGPAPPFPPAFWETLTPETARTVAERFIAAIPPYPGDEQGRGIVICGGGLTYFTSAWVNIRLLRHLGCTLPIQLWYLGPEEVDPAMAALVAPLGVECVDGLEMRRRHPARILNGWELKAYALLHCPFAEVLLLDADNLAVTDPQFLFETPQYRDTGALFWPDFGRLDASRPIWSLCGVAYRDEPEFESGQIVVDKRRCWEALCLSLWYNEHSDFFYQYVHGDKETFHLAFRKLGAPYAMPSRGVHFDDQRLMHQHDFDGNLLFQHQRKWDYYLTDHSEGFLYADECQEFLEDLRRRWDGEIASSRRYAGAGRPADERAAARLLTCAPYRYERSGHDCRTLTFSPDGLVEAGAGECETFWTLAPDGPPAADGNSPLALELSSEHQTTCRLRRGADGAWRGQWLHSEQMPVVLSPVPDGKAEAAALRIERELPASGRRGGIGGALTALAALALPDPVIVEVGSLRDARLQARQRAGWSTLCFGWYAHTFGARFHTVDRSAFASRVCRRATRHYGPSIRYHVEDGTAFLAAFPGPISLLYLDAWPPDDPPAERRCLDAYRALAHRPPLILIDDYSEEQSTYCQQLVSRAHADGYRTLFVQDSQICLAYGARPEGA